MLFSKNNQNWPIVLLLSIVTSCGLAEHSMKLRDFFADDTKALVLAIEKGNEKSALELLEKGNSLNVHGEGGITPLLWYVMQQDKKAMRLAIKLGADANFSTPDGDTPISMSSGASDDDLLLILLEGGGNPNVVDGSGRPAIFEAIGERRKKQIEMLIKFGADVNLKDKSNRNSALYAAYINQFEILHSLLLNGADHLIRDSGRADIAWLLYDLEKNNLLDKKSDSYKWALKVKEVLVERGVDFPPPSPREVRWTEGAPNQFDLESRDKKLKEGVPLEFYERAAE